MANINHPHIIADESRVARAGATNVRISKKNSVEISGFIRGMMVDKAILYLEEVLKKKKAVPYKKHIKDQAHRKGGMGPGRYPVDAAEEFIKLLKNVRNNADVKGFDSDRLVVENAQANLGGSRFHRGARRFGNRKAKSTNISITVKEMKMKKAEKVAKKVAEAEVKEKIKKAEAVKVEEKKVKKVEPVKVEAKKTEPVKVEEKEVKKVEPVKAEVKKIEPVKVEEKKAEPVKAEVKKAKPVKVEEKEVKKAAVKSVEKTEKKAVKK